MAEACDAETGTTAVFSKRSCGGGKVRLWQFTRELMRTCYDRINPKIVGEFAASRTLLVPAIDHHEHTFTGNKTKKEQIGNLRRV